MWGKIENGVKTGNWQYYDKADDNISLIINYTTNKVAYISPDTSNFLVLIDGNWKKQKVTTPPRYIGSKKQIHDSIKFKLSYPIDAIRNRIQGVAIISATVNLTGNLSDFEVVKKLSGGCSDQVISVVQELPNTWIPATINSKSINSKLFFVISFGIEEDYTPSKREIKRYPLLMKQRPYIYHEKVTTIQIERTRKKIGTTYYKH